MDYNIFKNSPPYSWNQEKKEKIYTTFLKELTQYHKTKCPTYNRMSSFWEPHSPTTLESLPYLPVQLFKMQELKSIPTNAIFKTLTSSGTSGQSVSKVFLDCKTAGLQQQALQSIVQDFLGKNRIPMLIIDSPNIFKDRDLFSARGAAILGFSIFAKKHVFALKASNEEPDFNIIYDFLQKYGHAPFLIFGFTSLIWSTFSLSFPSHLISNFSNAILIHGGGWKRLADQAVDSLTFRTTLSHNLGTKKIYNYYGMSEQTGSIFMECEYGHLHASIYSDIIIRDALTHNILPLQQEGIIQTLSPLAYSYPGHSILTEDLGKILGVDNCPCGRLGKYFSISGRIKHSELRGCSDVQH